MILLPLFGKDSSPHRTSLVLSIIITMVLWIVLSIGSIFIKIERPVKEYETIQIMLEPLSQTIEEVKENKPVPEEVPIAEMAEEPAIEETEASVEEIMEEVVQETIMETPVEAPVEPVVETPIVEVIETPAVEEVIPEPVPAPAPVVEQKPVVEEKPAEPVKKIETPKPVDKVVETPKPAPVETPKPVYNPEIQKSVDELMAEQMANKKKNEPVDWTAMFPEDDDFDTPAQTTTNKKVETKNTVTGSAASAATDNNQKQTTAKKEETSTTASSSTTKALDSIKSAKYVDKSSDSNTTTETSIAAAKSGDGKIQVQMADGSKRNLIKPSEPSIKLSEEAAKLVRDTVTVRIEFKVDTKGIVSQISVTPEAILPKEVVAEIKEQLSHSWLFDSAEQDATARFDYTIQKK